MTFTTAPSTTRRFAAALSTLALTCGTLAAAGCGSSSKSTSPTTPAAPATTGSQAAPSGAAKLKIAANPQGQLKYEPSSLSATAGTVAIEFTNAATLEHNLTLATPSGSVVASTPTFSGGTRTLIASLRPGTYKFYCTVPGHRQSGMEGTLTLK